MALMIDPKEESAGTARRYTGAGKKILWAAGVDWGTSQAGNRKISVRFACVGDPDKVDEGTQVFDTFTLTEKAAWKIRQFATAAEQNEPFDAESKESMNEILARRPVWAEVSIEPDHNGVDRSRITRYSKFAGEITEAMQDTVEELERYHEAGKSRSGAVGGGGNRSTAPSEDEIPF